jgi:hypothetical protein
VLRQMQAVTEHGFSDPLFFIHKGRGLEEDKGKFEMKRNNKQNSAAALCAPYLYTPTDNLI